MYWSELPDVCKKCPELMTKETEFGIWCKCKRYGDWFTMCPYVPDNW